MADVKVSTVGLMVGLAVVFSVGVAAADMTAHLRKATPSTTRAAHVTSIGDVQCDPPTKDGPGMCVVALHFEDSDSTGEHAWDEHTAIPPGALQQVINSGCTLEATARPASVTQHLLTCDEMKKAAADAQKSAPPPPAQPAADPLAPGPH